MICDDLPFPLLVLNPVDLVQRIRIVSESDTGSGTMSFSKFGGGLTRFSPRANLYGPTYLLGQSATTSVRYFMSTRKSDNAGKSNERLFKYGLGGMALGTVGYKLYSDYQSEMNKNVAKYLARKEVVVIDEIPPEVKITRKIVNHNDNSGLDLVLFQYQTCPFCCKVRAFLDAGGFTYSVVEVNAVLRQSIKWSKYKKVPMLLARNKDGKYVQLTESSMIISALSSYKLDPTVDLLDIAGFYPNVVFENDKGKQEHDILNKYFVMHKDKVPANSTKEELK